MGEPILTFEARAEWYGVPAREVLEVAQLRGVRPVPRAPGGVAGLAEIHGRIVTLIDLDRMLSGTAPEPGASGFGVVLAPPLDHLGLLIRSAIDVAPAPEAGAPPEPREDGGLLSARLPVGERLLNLLSLPAVVSRVEEAIREGFVRGQSPPGEEA
jgi:chemotaxis signal transduction protein